MKKIVLSFVGVLTIVILITGCGASIQNVEKPDIHKPLSDQESIIQLKRADNFMGSGRKPDIIANDKFVGEIANDDELVWKTKANAFECISIDYDSNLVELILVKGIVLDSTPLSYKCFFTKPKEILSLNYDFLYPNMRAARPLAFVPIFKDIDKSKALPVSINSITSSVETESNIDLIKLLKEAIEKQFKDKLINSSNKTIDLEILDYKTGNAALRWLASSHNGSTLVKVKVTIKEDNKIIDTFITRPVISYGGLFTIGGDEYILDEVAEDVYLNIFEPLKVKNDNN